MEVYLSTAYFPNVQYFSKFIPSDLCFIEGKENFIKQSFRNRMQILSANGLLNLSIPIQKTESLKIPIESVQICYETNWPKIHWKAIESAYNNSPFFEFYQDDFKVFFDQKFDLLFDLNCEVLKKILQILGIRQQIGFTQKYYAEGAFDNDFRYKIHPKANQNIADENFKPVPYYQVFIEKFGFVPNLSILDLIFNEGPQSLSLLKSMIK